MHNFHIQVVKKVFSVKWKIPFGKAVYIVGNVEQLGQWEIKQAKKLQYRQQNQWVIAVNLRVGMEIEYKYFYSNFEQISMNSIQNQNFSQPYKQQVQQIPNPPPSLSLCSLNIRFSTQQDGGKLSWDKRKLRIVQYINKKKCSVFGVQQATYEQRLYLQQELKDYAYYGRQRDQQKNQQCGIFVNKQYKVIQDSYHWIQQVREEGTVGYYDAKLLRYFTGVIITRKQLCTSYKKIPCFLVVNLHLDDQGAVSRRKGIQIIMQFFKSTKKRFDQDKIFTLSGFAAMGDYNESQNSHIFDPFRKDSQLPLKSMRQLGGDDKSITYNGFSTKFMLKVQKLFNIDKLIIDHIFYWLSSDPQVYYPVTFQVEQSETEDELMSDHYPIIGTFLSQAFIPA